MSVHLGLAHGFWDWCVLLVESGAVHPVGVRGEAVHPASGSEGGGSPSLSGSEGGGSPPSQWE